MQLARVAVTLACHSSSFAFKHDSSLDNVKAQQFPGPWNIMETRLGLPQVTTGKHALSTGIGGQMAGYAAGPSSLRGLSLPI